MQKLLLLFILPLLIFEKVNAQTEKSALELRLTDTICNCLSRADLSKITNKDEAVAVITDCFGKRTDLLTQLAAEKHVSYTDNDAMRKIGTEIGLDLFNQNCAAFSKLSVKMVENKVVSEDIEGYNEGKFKRIDIKGFNYIVISGKDGSEKSFIWLRQFPGSEKFMNNTNRYVGKNIKIKYQEFEVYLPQAKGYYKVKEIISVDIL